LAVSLEERLQEYAQEAAKVAIRKVLVSLTLKILAYVGPVLLLLLLIVFILTPSLDEPAEQPAPSEVSPQGSQEIPKQYIPIYFAAAVKYRVPWQYLAGIHRVETNFSRDLRTSSVGAIGHMQWMEASWAGWKYPHDAVGNITIDIDITDPEVIAKGGGYGTDGDGDGKADPYNLVDAVFSTAKYLAAHGASSGKIDQAIYAYNHSSRYVEQVKTYAEQYSQPAAQVIQATGKFISPVDGGVITSTFGYRFHPTQKVWKMHKGVDIGRYAGAPIRAVADGIVTKAGPSTGYGNAIVIRHDHSTETLYGHMYAETIKVKPGDRVKQGQVIAAIGSAGWSTGPHLHFEVHKDGQPVDPLPYLPKLPKQ